MKTVALLFALGILPAACFTVARSGKIMRQARAFHMSDAEETGEAEVAEEDTTEEVAQEEVTQVAPVAIDMEAAVEVSPAKADLMAYADSIPGPVGFWDPIGATSIDFWGLGEEGTIGYLRHAEIKHGRVAMAGFLGFCVQSMDIVKGEHAIAPYKGYIAGCTPQEQWNNIPLYGKIQILIFIGMLESYGEGAGAEGSYVHYTKGGKPGYYPDIKGKAFGQIPFNLFDPFELLPEKSAGEKERGLKAEVNNGRAAMLGLFAVLSASKGLVVPPLDYIDGFPKYSGNIMAPFSNDFSLLSL